LQCFNGTSRVRSFSFVPDFAFAHSPLDRLSAIRNNEDKLKKLRESKAVSCVRISGDQLLFDGDTPDFSPPKPHENIILLGRDPAQKNWFATATQATDSLKSIRQIMIDGALPKEVLSIIAQARSLVHWHETHGFCARCGTASVMSDAGYRRHCPACHADHFPRTDPVVIMAVTRHDKVLLGRQASWPHGMFSVLAGFLEPGETIEQAVRREVKEESGIEIGRVEYFASQPWPFPASLMIGVIAEALNDHIEIDATEIEQARWVGADELRLMLDNKHPDGLTASRRDAIAWHLSVAALQRLSVET
jgi:NAD+ diphosphatase